MIDRTRYLAISHLAPPHAGSQHRMQVDNHLCAMIADRRHALSFTYQQSRLFAKSKGEAQGLLCSNCIQCETGQWNAENGIDNDKDTSKGSLWRDITVPEVLLREIQKRSHTRSLCRQRQRNRPCSRSSPVLFRLLQKSLPKTCI